MAVASDPTPIIACVPSAIPSAARVGHFALAHRLLTELARERVDLSDGYAFRFEADAFETLARFVANERQCCPFMAFDLQLASESGPIWLRMTGPAGTREVVQAELGMGACSGNPLKDEASQSIPLSFAVPIKE